MSWGLWITWAFFKELSGTEMHLRKVTKVKMLIKGRVGAEDLITVSVFDVYICV